MDVISKLFLPVSLAFIMFSMGLALVVADFKRVAVHPLAAGVGLACQMLVLPAVAFALVSLWSLSPELAVGIMILAACPGGITSNLLTHLARGDTALSVSLTAIASLAGVITVPLIANLALANFAGATEAVALPVGKMIGGVFVISTLPLIAGMAIRHFKAGWADWLEPKARKLATVLFAIIVAGAFAGQWHNLVAHFDDVGPVALVLNAVVMALGFGLAKLLGLGRGQGIAISLESGLQNAALGIFVGATLLNNEMMMVPSIVYALLMNVTAAVFILAVLLPRRAAA